MYRTAECFYFGGAERTLQKALGPGKDLTIIQIRIRSLAIKVDHSVWNSFIPVGTLSSFLTHYTKWPKQGEGRSYKYYYLAFY
jgi:hypothetical protein